MIFIEARKHFIISTMCLIASPTRAYNIREKFFKESWRIFIARAHFTEVIGGEFFLDESFFPTKRNK
jgi:hypothetical protein